MSVSSKQQELVLGGGVSDWLVLSQIYPSSGIVGVVEEPVQPELRSELRRYLNIDDSMLVEFCTIVSVKGISA